VKGRVWVSDFGFSGFGFLVLGTGSKGYRKSGEERIRIVLACPRFAVEGKGFGVQVFGIRG